MRLHLTVDRLEWAEVVVFDVVDDLGLLGNLDEGLDIGHNFNFVLTPAISDQALFTNKTLQNLLYLPHIQYLMALKRIDPSSMRILLKNALFYVLLVFVFIDEDSRFYPHRL